MITKARQSCMRALILSTY